MDAVNHHIKVIALDPGITTGYAEGVIDSTGFMKVRAGQAKWDHLSLYDSIRTQHPHHIICESFQFRKTGKKQEGVELFPVELIGVVTYYVQQINAGGVHVKLHMQTAAKGKGYYTDDKLKEANLYRKGLPHSRDATRHILQWFTFGYGYQFNKKGFGPWTED